MRRTLPVLLVGLLVAACGSDDDASAPTSAAPTATDAATTTTTPPETAASVTAEVATTDAPATDPPVPDPSVPDWTAGEWEAITPGGDCACADGSEFTFWDRPADPSKVVLFLQGGGACFDAATCQFQGGTYSSTVGASPDLFGGIFDFAAAENPVADHSVVYVPYCTGDVHIGDAIADYDGLTVRHVGHVNVSAAIDHLVTAYPDATEIVVTGISAGSVPSPLYAGELADRYPDATISVLADGSGAYSQDVSVSSTVGSTWGAMAALPAWPSADGLPPDVWSIPGLFVRAAAHAPDVRFARFDFAYDSVQQLFLGLTGTPADDLLTEIHENEAWIEAETGTELPGYTAPGADHTILLSDRVYDLEVDGVRLIDWIGSYLAGGPVNDVRCTSCQP